MSVSSLSAQDDILTFRVLDHSIHGVDAASLTDLVERAIDSQESCIIANHNLHSLHLCKRDAKLRSFFERAKWVHADGMWIVLIGRLLGAPLDRSMRTTYVDWTPLLMSRAATEGWRIFYIGSKPGVADRGATILRREFPGLEISVANGYFDVHGTDNDELLERMRSFSPDLVMVGMGMPRQEHWIYDNADRLGPAVFLPCGATIDYVAGAVPTPPRWAGRYGMEWLYRLIAEPRRLWRRYLVEPWSVSFLIAQHYARRVYAQPATVDSIHESKQGE